MNGMDYFAIGLAVLMAGCLAYGIAGPVHSFSLRRRKGRTTSAPPAALRP